MQSQEFPDDSSVNSNVSVLIPLPVAGPYTYSVPEGMQLRVGDFVQVPLGPREVRGVVWPTGEVEQSVSAKKLKSVTSKFDCFRLSGDVIDFVDWVATYTMFPSGTVLRMVMRSGAFLISPKPLKGFMLSHSSSMEGQTEKRMQVLTAARGSNFPLSASALAEKAGVSDGVVRALVKSGDLEVVETDPDTPFDLPVVPGKIAELSEEQSVAVTEIKASVDSDRYSCVLIDGVTGAGKTEVYLEAVAHALAKNRDAQVLILLPEISLTLPFLKRLEKRFGAKPAHWHSDVGQAERRRVWRRVGDGSARIVVGARSALFLPFRNLQMIVVDEEHEAAYKQHEGVLYQARDMAVVRGARGGFPVVLATATPSLETMINTQLGRYKSVQLTRRFGGALFPEISLVDMRQEKMGKEEWLSPRLSQAVSDNLAKQEQSLLYLNRRGYAPLTICRKCGERIMAPDSDTWLVEHRFTNMLVCHHTGFSMPKPAECPHCGSVDSLAPCGPGVERIAEEARRKWPSARIAVFSSDTVPTNASATELLAKMVAGEIDILVATQIAAKGHHFPDLTLVGIIDADLGLAGGDLRAGERTWQVLNQVAGRAGRSKKAGRVLMQTYQPEHPVISGMAAGDRIAFMQAEREGRELSGFPPFGRLAAVLLSGDNEAKVADFGRQLASEVPHAEKVDVWGPAPAALYRLRGNYRMRFLVKSTRDIAIQSFIQSWLGRVKIPSSIRLTVDIDPYSFT